jgi:tetratricopeptide (TPR) repeat protein
MQLFMMAGDRAAALQAFQQCERVLSKELEVEPEAETLALARRIRAEMPAVPPPRSGASALPLELPFVGRAGEHSALVNAYRAAAEGRAQVVPAGMGKTRLTQGFLAWAAVQKADVLNGRALEAGGQLPYQPLVAALRERVERENAPADLLPEVWLTELSRLLPELLDRYSDLAPPASSDPNLARSNLFEALAQLVQALARRKPVVLCLDDVHWADSATLDVLPYLCRRWTESQSRVLLIVTVRSETLVATPHLREWLIQLTREINLTRLPLRPLTRHATRQLVHALAAGSAERESASERFGDWLFAETAGQPYFMAETVKMLVEQNILQADYHTGRGWTLDFEPAMQRIESEGRLPIPASIREVILSRLGRLSGTAVALAEAAAILGRAASFEELSRVSGADELAGLPALDELLGSQLLIESARAQRPYAFSHDKIRDAICAEAGEARRRVYHRRAFAGLEPGSVPAAEVAHHALAAHLWEPAFRYSVAAGDQAAGVYAHLEAARHYRRALELGTRGQTDTDDEKLTDLFLRLGRSLELMSRFPEALAVYDEMEAAALARHNRAMELAAQLARIPPLATVTAVFDPVGAEQVIERALELARATSDRSAEVDVLWNQLNLFRVTNRLSQAADAGERALVLARALGRRERLAFILNDLGYCYAFVARFSRAREMFGEAGALWRALGNLPMLADSLTGDCMACTFGGYYDAAIVSFEEALRISREIGSLWALATCRHNIGFVLADRGDANRAIGEMEEGIRVCEEGGPISPLIFVRADLALLYASLGAIDRAMQLARLAVSIAETRLPVLGVYPLAALNHLCLMQGNVAEAEELVARLKADPNRSALGIFPTMILQAEAELALAHGQHERAAGLAGQAAAAALEAGARPFGIAALDVEGQAWLGLGCRELARQRWESARAEAEALGARRRLWPILAELSRLEQDPLEADRLRQQARALVSYIGGKAPTELRDFFLGLPAVRELRPDLQGRSPG